jgi:hypothetical protein
VVELPFVLGGGATVLVGWVVVATCPATRAGGDIGVEGVGVSGPSGRESSVGEPAGGVALVVFQVVEDHAHGVSSLFSLLLIVWVPLAAGACVGGGRGPGRFVRWSLSGRLGADLLHEQLVGEQEGDGWPGGDESADEGRLGGGDVGGHRCGEPGEHGGPGQPAGGPTRALSGEHGARGGEDEPVDADGEQPGAPVLAGHLGEEALMVVGRDGRHEGDGDNGQCGGARNARARAVGCVRCCRWFRIGQPVDGGGRLRKAALCRRAAVGLEVGVLAGFEDALASPAARSAEPAAEGHASERRPIAYAVEICPAGGGLPLGAGRPVTVAVPAG